jgi:hypothetical protein
MPPGDLFGIGVRAVADYAGNRAAVSILAADVEIRELSATNLDQGLP